ncbi:hypothetical protein [Pseudomonas veronii]
MQLNQIINEDVQNQELIEETAVILDLLAFALAIIASPSTPPVLTQALAILSYNCAANWAAMLHGEAAAVEGGAQ